MAKPGATETCLNCSFPLEAETKFCPQCGQKRIHAGNQSVWHLILESVGDFFHLDSKFIGTLRPLLFNPGFLTVQYLEGRRIRYFEPFKLFLFLSFLFFLTSGLLNHRRAGIDFEKAGYLQKADSIMRSRHKGSFSLNLNKAYEEGIAVPDDSLRRMILKSGLSRFVEMKYPGASPVTKFLVKQMIKNRLEGSASLDENMKKTMPKLVFILIPFFALILKLLYRGKKVLYFNHLIFSLHFLSFFFLLFTFKEFVALAAGWLNPAFSLILLGYLFFALRRVYGQKTRATLGRFLLLISGSLLLLLLFFITSATISFMMI
jgi:hypothetical protein